MRRLSDTVARLAALRGQSNDPAARSSGRLEQLRDFGTNPGNLDAWCHVPKNLGDAAALVVVLHGCTQNAAGYDEGSGWSQLADELGFAVLYPEQTRANNFNLCFNWYEPGDSRRGAGEPLSIVQMIAHMVAAHGLDASRVFVTGLSAGGAMTSVMLATYPEIFASGAILSGLPYGCAGSVSEALQLMRQQASPDIGALADAILRAAPASDRRPRISIWHGGADHVVSTGNADAILAQWQAVHGLLGEPDSSNRAARHVHRTWRDPGGAVMIEDHRISGMGHGTPLATRGSEACGTAGPHMLDVGISSTRRISAFWGLERASETASAPMALGKTVRAIGGLQEQNGTDAPPHRPTRMNAHPGASSSRVGNVIEDALRAAGLMR